MTSWRVLRYRVLSEGSLAAMAVWFRLDGDLERAKPQSQGLKRWLGLTTCVAKESLGGCWACFLSNCGVVRAVRSSWAHHWPHHQPSSSRWGSGHHIPDASVWWTSPEFTTQFCTSFSPVHLTGWKQHQFPPNLNQKKVLVCMRQDTNSKRKKTDKNQS